MVSPIIISCKERNIPMKYYAHCGSKVHDEAEICMNCGCRIKNRPSPPPAPAYDDSLTIIVKIFYDSQLYQSGLLPDSPGLVCPADNLRF